MKLLGIILLTTASVIFGTTLSSRLSKRVEMLITLEKAIDETKDIIRYTAEETDGIIHHLKGKYPMLFSGNLRNDDFVIIKELVDGLGKTDREGQLDFCNGLKRCVSRNLREAETEKQAKSKLYTVLGLSFGLAFSIILI